MSVHKTLLSRQLWAPVRQTMRQVKQPDGNRTAEFYIAVNGPTVWHNLIGFRVLDSSLVGFKHVLKTHLFTFEQQKPSTGVAATSQ